jgi:hypothetical protein
VTADFSDFPPTNMFTGIKYADMEKGSLLRDYKIICGVKY